MMVHKETAALTGKQLAEMGDIGPCELVAGKIIYLNYATPRHGYLLARLASLFGDFVETRRMGDISIGGVGIYTYRDPDTVRATDLLFISHERMARATHDEFLDVAPELVAEILSDDDKWSYFTRKLREYFEAGVTLVLVVDPEERTIFAYRSLTDLREFTDNDVLAIEDVLPGFSLPVAELFVA